MASILRSQDLRTSFPPKLHIGHMWFILAGAALGAATWLFTAPIALTLLLPVIWLNARNRWTAGGVVVAYYLAGAFDIISITQAFFGESMATGVAAWLGQAALLAIPWLILWAPNRSGAIWRTIVVMLATIIPPWGLINWLSPMLAAGELFPGAGLAGILATVALTVALIAWPRWPMHVRYQILVLVVAVSCGLNGLVSLSPRPPAPAGWVGVNTALGVLPPDDRAAQFDRAGSVKKMAVQHAGQGTLVVLPEGIVGRWRPAVRYWLGPTAILVGADVHGSSPGYRNALVDARDGHVVASARIPMPVSLWKPWAPETSAHANPLGAGVTEINGHRAAISFCYEDLIVFPHLVSLAHQPEVLLSVANNWFIRDGSRASSIQERSVSAVARLFFVPLVRAVNFDSDKHEWVKKRTTTQ